MLKTLGENLHVDSRVSNFFVPVAASLARCGSCIFICLSSLFLTQLEGMSIDASKVVIIGYELLRGRGRVGGWVGDPFKMSCFSLYILHIINIYRI